MDFSEFLTGYVYEESFLFDGFVLGFCLRGSLAFKFDYAKFEVSSGGFFVILPHRLFSVVSSSSDLDLKIFLLSTDFILSLPVSPDFQMLKKADACPCLQLEDSVSEDIQVLYRMIERYGEEDLSVAQVRNALMCSIIFIVSSSFERRVQSEVKQFSRSEALTRQFFDLLLLQWQRKEPWLLRQPHGQSGSSRCPEGRPARLLSAEKLRCRCIF